MTWSIVSANGLMPPYALRSSAGSYDRLPSEPGETLGKIREFPDRASAEARLAELVTPEAVRVRPRPGVYLASRYSRKRELQSYVSLFERHGLEVVSRWLTTDQHALVGVENPNGGDLLNGMTVKQQGAIARMDLADIRRAHAFVAFTERPGSEVGQRGGRLVEYGYALGLGKPVVICGPLESFFFMLEDDGIAQRDTPEGAAKLLAEWARKGVL